MTQKLSLMNLYCLSISAKFSFVSRMLAWLPKRAGLAQPIVIKESITDWYAFNKAQLGVDGDRT